MNYFENNLFERKENIEKNIGSLNNFELLHYYSEARNTRKQSIISEDESIWTDTAREIVFSTYDILLHEVLRRMGEFDN